MKFTSRLFAVGLGLFLVSGLEAQTTTPSTPTVIRPASAPASFAPASAASVAASGTVAAPPPAVSPQSCRPNVRRSKPDRLYQIIAGGDGSEIFDRDTSLVWRRCLEGMRWDGRACTGQAQTYSWNKALAYAKQVRPSGNPATAWRVPNKDELLSLVEPACIDPAANLNWFGKDPGAVWSSDPYADVSDNAWYVYYFLGGEGLENKSKAMNLRLVRSFKASTPAAPASVASSAGTAPAVAPAPKSR